MKPQKQYTRWAVRTKMWCPCWCDGWDIHIRTHTHSLTHSLTESISFKEMFTNEELWFFLNKIWTSLTFCLGGIVWQIRASPNPIAASGGYQLLVRSPSHCSEWWMPAWVQLQLLGLVSESTEAPKRPSTSITDYNLLRQTTDFIQINCSIGRQFSILFPHEGGFTVVAVGEIQSGQISGP